MKKKKDHVLWSALSIDSISVNTIFCSQLYCAFSFFPLSILLFHLPPLLHLFLVAKVDILWCLTHRYHCIDYMATELRSKEFPHLKIFFLWKIHFSVEYVGNCTSKGPCSRDLQQTLNFYLHWGHIYIKIKLNIKYIKDLHLFTKTHLLICALLFCNFVRSLTHSLSVLWRDYFRFLF